VVETSARDFTTAGDLSFIDDGVATVQAFAPVPEPSTWAMLAIGFGLLGFVAHKRANRGRHAVA
jgi:hypothetical protein